MLLPTLPIETWKEIFRLAVYIPNHLQTKWDCPPEVDMWRGWAGEPDCSESIRTRRALVQVSRRWRELSIELLHQSVSLPASIDAERIARLAVVFRSAEESCGKGPGWWTSTLR